MPISLRRAVLWTVLVALAFLVLARTEPAEARPSASTVRRLLREARYLPIVRQATGFSCGVASLMCVLQKYTRFDGAESDLYRRLGTTPRSGTRPERIAQVAQQFGLGAEVKEGLDLKALRRALREKKEVILDLQAWRLDQNKKKPWSKLWHDGHYVVLRSLGTKYISFMDPSAGPAYAYMPIKEFLDRWRDFEYQPGSHRWRKYIHTGIVIDPRGKRPAEGPGLIRME